ncbi:hypothetical protein ACFQFH_17250 [Halobaculum halobium]|uniref:Zinc ribbon domain-containing protein n=1 Tax=Halobaculum halobium TaxID=3032281 RepID=A0ABD5TE05_9EURY|nr:hypothetical protein [Halobaculum sp. SYNS20]
MVGVLTEPVVRLLLTGVLCLVPTIAFLGLLRLLERLRNDVLVEHTIRMAAEEGATAGAAATRADPAVAFGVARDGSTGRSEPEPADETDWEDPRPTRRLVLCSACATLRSPRPGACPTCGAALDAAADRSDADLDPEGEPRRP